MDRPDPTKGPIMHRYRTQTCAELRASDVGDTVRLSGWVHRVRDHGGILFVDLRDHYGITQCLADPDSPAFRDVETLRAEWCVRIDGVVKARDASLVNPKIPTGEVEVFIREVEVLGPAGELPLQVFGDQEYPEETRLRYRFLDLRREEMQRKMALRSDVVRSLRQRMWDQGFREYQTPIITASSPEGARDFLVPSRLHPGKFYALPRRRSSSSSSSWCRASTATSRSRPASATRTRARTARPPTSTSSTSRCPSSPRRTCSPPSSR
jgi:aspartyl-tRNA synthetase